MHNSEEKYKNPRLSVKERIEDLLQKMTLEEKAAQLDMGRGVELVTKEHPAHFCTMADDADFLWDKIDSVIGEKGIGCVHDIYSIPRLTNILQKYAVEKTRLGIPMIFTGEALHGLCRPDTTVFPSPIGLGATFNPGLVEEVGHAIAAETRSLGLTEVLSPNLDLAREPRWGRTEETFGEDTHLSSQMAYSIVHGLQGDDVSCSDRVVAEPKHYCVHAIPEKGLNCSPARVGVREVETSYLPVFEAGVKKAKAYNVMGSYNSIDGETVIDSYHYLTEVLRDRWGMRGYVRADFGAVLRLHDTHKIAKSNKMAMKSAISAGLDMQGFDFPNVEWQSGIIELVNSGEISIERLDEAVSRVLRVKFELGLFEKPYVDETNYLKVIRSKENLDLTLRAGRESICLLKNENNILPLPKKNISIAVVGPHCDSQQIGGYSPIPYSYKPRSIYSLIKERYGDSIEVKKAEGCSATGSFIEIIPADWYTYDGINKGVEAEYFSNSNFEGLPCKKRIENGINFNWMLTKPSLELEFTGYSARFKGFITVDIPMLKSGDTFQGKLLIKAIDSTRIYIDGKLIINSFNNNIDTSSIKNKEASFTFQNGKTYSFEMEYIRDGNGNNVAIYYENPIDPMDEALKIAKESDYVIVVCGDDDSTSGEGKDRCELTLPGKQYELIKNVYEVNKNVILVLENGRPIELNFENEHLPAIIESWFPGEKGGEAITDVIFGDYNPSGRLPISFPRSTGYLPCYYSAMPGGARYYCNSEAKNVYNFGHGLSYTEFEYSDLKVTKKEGNYNYDAEVTIKNVGKYDGDEVVQLYINDVYSSVVTPLKELKSFKRIHVKSGQSETVRMTLDFDSFKLLDRKFNWVVEPGDFEIMIGASSDDIRLTTVINISCKFV